jgi:hypothetical protein
VYAGKPVSLPVQNWQKIQVEMNGVDQFQLALLKVLEMVPAPRFELGTY